MPYLTIRTKIQPVDWINLITNYYLTRKAFEMTFSKDGNASKNHLRATIFLLMLLVLSFFSSLFLSNANAQAGREKQFFPETNHSVEGQFLTYWNNNGGLAQYGYPITDAYLTTNGRLTQVFERAIFEWWPENPAAFKVQLALLGNLLSGNSRRTNPAAFIPVANGVSTDAKSFYKETGHYISEPFRTYWNDNGGIPTYGYPISEDFREISATDGKSYITQYFERNRFEYHPENAGTEFEVLLGLLGSEYAKSHPQDFPLTDTPQTSAWDLVTTGAKGTYPPVPTALTTLPPAPSSSTFKVEGSGTNASGKFQLVTGITLVKINGTSTGQFQANLIDSKGAEVTTLVSVEGPYNGTRYFSIETTGTYLLNVTADSNWSFEFTDFNGLRNQPSAIPPSPISGKGDVALPKYSLAQGLTIFTISYSGSDSLAITIFDEENSTVSDISVQGPFNGTKAVGFPVTGVYYFTVLGTDSWSIDIKYS
jgi:hypothetical protein